MIRCTCSIIFLKKRKKFPRQHSMSEILCACQGVGVLSHRYHYQGGIEKLSSWKGLFGKIEFNSTMTSRDIILEVSCVFSSPMGLSKTEIEEEEKKINFFVSVTGWCRVTYTMQAFCIWFFWMEWKTCGNFGKIWRHNLCTGIGYFAIHAG